MFLDAIQATKESIPLCDDLSSDTIKNRCKNSPLDGLLNQYPRKGFLYRTATEVDKKDRDYFNLKYCDPESLYSYDGDDPYTNLNSNINLSIIECNNKKTNNNKTNNKKTNKNKTKTIFFIIILIFLVLFLIWLFRK